MRPRIRSLLADEMGLGKTPQAVTVGHEWGGKKLVIVPATLADNWQNEIGKWTPADGGVGVLYSGKSKYFSEKEWTICSYNLLEKHLPALSKTIFEAVMLDEAHYIKNSKSRRSKAVHGRLGHKLQTHRKLAITGTPILNRPIDIYSTLRWLEIPKLPDYYSFARKYCAAWQSPWGLDVSGASNTDDLHRRLIKSCMLRRLKKDVLPDLPPKFRQIVVLNDANIERAVRAEKEGIPNYEEVLAMMEAGGSELIVLGSLAEERQAVALAKLPAAIEHIQALLEVKNKLVIFAHHKAVISALAKAFPDHALIDGDTPVKKRSAEVSRFQTDSNCRIFIGNIIAAGVGITLTAADTVVFCELSWVPADMNQAEDRLHRIGQVSECVTVQHLVANRSLDHYIAQKLIMKQNIITKAIDGVA